MRKESQQISVMNWRRGHLWNGLIRILFVSDSFMLNRVASNEPSSLNSINMSKFIKSLKHFIICSFFRWLKSKQQFQIDSYLTTDGHYFPFSHWSKAKMQQRKQKAKCEINKSSESNGSIKHSFGRAGSSAHHQSASSVLASGGERTS